MKIVGIDFRDGILFVPEVLLAANAMKAGMAILRPLLAETGAEPIGKVVIGTVKGDIHDIGKNLVGDDARRRRLRGLRPRHQHRRRQVHRRARAAQAGHPRACRALLTTTMPYMKVVIDELKKRGMRDDYIVLVGGAPLNEEFGAGGRRGRLLPRRRRRRRDRPAPDRRTPCARRLGLTRRGTHPAAASSSSAVARWRASSSRSPRSLPGSTSTCLPRRAAQPPGAHSGRGRGTDRRARADGYDRIFVAYADCGTGGLLDRSSRDEGVERLPGAHCYEFYAGRAAFAALAEEEPGTFYLTDFLARNFEPARLARPRPAPSPGAAARLLRQLPAARVPRADRRPGARRRGRGRGRQPRPGLRAPA